MIASRMKVSRPLAASGAPVAAPDGGREVDAAGSNLAQAAPMHFGPPEARLFGWYHAGAEPRRTTGIVLCIPLGAEGISAYRCYTELAEQLAASGFPVLRFDYHGTGDSAGGDEDPRRLDAWRDSVRDAADRLKACSLVDQVGLFGVRSGATLAALAAATRDDIASVVLWAPFVTGRQLVRELRAGALLKAPNPAERPTVEAEARKDVEAFGFLYTDATLSDLAKIDLRRLDRRPAPRALVIGRDDLPGDGGLTDALKVLGAEAQYHEPPGYAAMMREPHESAVPHRVIHEVVCWLETQHPARLSSDGGCSSASAPRALQSGVDIGGNVGQAGVREVPIFFGERQNLFGILTGPGRREGECGADRSVARIAVLMLNVGTNHRVGPNRMYVKMARSWAAHDSASLRFDLAGIGDSRAGGQFSDTQLYSKQSVDDVRRAMDALSSRYGYQRFVLMGLCSGAYVAFQTALADARVAGQILLNPRRLVWNEGDTLRGVMQRTFKSTHYYRQAIKDLATWKRLLRGELDVRGVAGRLTTLAVARARRVWTTLLGRGADEEDVLMQMRGLARRGTRILILVGTHDDCLDYLEYHLGTKGERMRGEPNFEMRFVNGSDHTFTRVKTQQALSDAVSDYLRRLERVLDGRTPLSPRHLRPD